MWRWTSLWHVSLFVGVFVSIIQFTCLFKILGCGRKAPRTPRHRAHVHRLLVTHQNQLNYLLYTHIWHQKIPFQGEILYIFRKTEKIIQTIFLMVWWWAILCLSWLVDTRPEVSWQLTCCQRTASPIINHPSRAGQTGPCSQLLEPWKHSQASPACRARLPHLQTRWL